MDGICYNNVKKAQRRAAMGCFGKKSLIRIITVLELLQCNLISEVMRKYITTKGDNFRGKGENTPQPF